MQRTDKVWWCIAALSGAMMVMLGAYAAHGLAARTTEAMVSAVETGVRYQAWHTLAVMIVLVWRQVQPLAGQRWVLALWALGMSCFSGSLYLMALAGLNLGIVTPIGGLLLMAGWLALGAVALLAQRRHT
ncbi:DUF423 domain-containing protein [Vreelandella neptunia]|uniref:DUF423 domain-containing protein n=1 Tax=Vreelandella neptunia TaxID=115551 RepID=A0ABZ0YLZ6_9GAMM|nr:DUF423 domain-containing protein [Halomonas neptunia]MDN3560438.1 DUF423 domain-containing protein [Halomonas neptunia]TDV88846.1 uncharacterized membrane protein YgdD (TMEM256/DUF423 family) [Halomonas alkaliantarctica]WQH12639.1 DUF423 domain-containing protein [Halomonas neptunia]